MENEVWLDEGNHMVRQRLIDDVTLTEAPKYFAQFKRILDELPHRRATVDLAKADEGGFMKGESWEYIVSRSILTGYKKMAYINLSPSLRIFSKVISKIAFKKHKNETEIGFFKPEEEALEWLKGDAKK